MGAQAIQERVVHKPSDAIAAESGRAMNMGLGP